MIGRAARTWRASVWVVLVVVVAMAGCGRRARGGADGASSSGSEQAPYAGPVTFRNASSIPVCEVQLPGGAPVRGEIAPGGETTLTSDGRAERIWVTGCDGQGLVAGRSANVVSSFGGPISRPLVVLYDAGGAASAPADQHALEVSADPFEPAYREIASHLIRDFTPAGPLASYADASMAALRLRGQQRSYRESFLTLEVLSPQWIVSRHRATGAVTGRHVDGVVIAQFPEGKCLMYGGSFVQEAMGAQFLDTITSPGLGGGFEVPCSLATYAASRPGIAR